MWSENDTLALDYNPGNDWNEERVTALFQLLWLIKQNIPNARIIHADEGCHHHPHPEFTKAFDAFIATKN